MEQLIRETSVHADCYDCVVGIRIAANDPTEMFTLTVLHEGTNLSGWSVIGFSREGFVPPGIISSRFAIFVDAVSIAANDPAEMFPLTVLHEGTNPSGWSVIGFARECMSGAPWFQSSQSVVESEAVQLRRNGLDFWSSGWNYSSPEFRTTTHRQISLRRSVC
ncbi:hypothetical protein ACLKA6_009729 [Drosophila palustris]